MARKGLLDFYTDCWSKHQELLTDPRWEEPRSRAIKCVDDYKKYALSPERLEAFGMSKLSEWCDYRVVFGHINRKDEDWIDGCIKYADCAPFLDDKKLLKKMVSSYFNVDSGSRQWGYASSGAIMVGERYFSILGQALYEYSDRLDSEDARVVAALTVNPGWALKMGGVITIYMVVKNLKMLPKIARFLAVDFNDYVNPDEKQHEYSIELGAAYYSAKYRDVRSSRQSESVQQITSSIEQALIDWIRAGKDA